MLVLTFIFFFVLIMSLKLIKNSILVPSEDIVVVCLRKCRCGVFILLEYLCCILLIPQSFGLLLRLFFLFVCFGKYLPKVSSRSFFFKRKSQVLIVFASSLTYLSFSVYVCFYKPSLSFLGGFCERKSGTSLSASSCLFQLTCEMSSFAAEISVQSKAHMSPSAVKNSGCVLVTQYKRTET